MAILIFHITCSFVKVFRRGQDARKKLSESIAINSKRKNISLNRSFFSYFFVQLQLDKQHISI